MTAAAGGVEVSERLRCLLAEVRAAPSATPIGARLGLTISKGCKYCKQMEAEVIPIPSVKAELGKFVIVKLDAFAEEELSYKYDVNALPAYIVTDASGKAVAMIEGYQEPEIFTRFLQLAGSAVATPQP